jgi:hypothetical protein
MAAYEYALEGKNRKLIANRTLEWIVWGEELHDRMEVEQVKEPFYGKLSFEWTIEVLLGFVEYEKL